MKLKTLFAGIALAVMVFGSFDMKATDENYDSRDQVLIGGNPAKKLGRGICNVALGALEIPIKIYDVNQEEGGLAAVTYGAFLGIGYCVAREVIGVLEVVTFLMPLPGCKDDPREDGWGYGPIMYPEWVVDQQHDIYNIIYQDLPVN